MKRAIIAALFLVPILMMGQQEEKKFGISFNGFVKNDFFWDSRQTVDAREGHFYLYPANELLDENGEDINARPHFNFLSIQTRLRGDITGPDVLGAKTSAAIEGEFFGHTDPDINGFRLRHAYIKLNWKTTELLMGQYWHPMFITASYPATVNFNTGVPFLPFSRNPQIRLTQSFGGFKAYLTALSQVDFKSTGPDGSNAKYLRNTAVPAFNLNLEYHYDNSDGFKFLIGVAGGIKTLLPRMVTDSNFKTSEKISTLCAQGYIKIAVPVLTIKLQGTYAQDAYDLLMIGGYAVNDITDPVRDFREYTPLNTFSAWADIHTNGKKIQGGLFFGYSKNLGASEIINGPAYARGSNVGYLYRISPRLIYNVGKFRIAPEVDYTVAAYGKFVNGTDGIPMDTKEAGNLRFLLGVFYFF
jgi:hypothetical protein